MTPYGVVVIGRNEGPRLVHCLKSVIGTAAAVIYVDSGSTDNSVSAATDLGADVVQLDPTMPFTAARARNAGFRRLIESHPRVEYVQFVDGDCEVMLGWLMAAQHELAVSSKTAVVCGRRRERYPERSVYNRLCDMEWDTLVGEADACGGDALIRTAAFRQVGGYDDKLIAGEEPELCSRLRAAGWRVVRLPAEMTLHDAAMTRFGQWWRRAVRGGHAYAEVAARHGRGGLRSWRRQVRSNWFWAVVLPVVAAASMAVSPWLALGVLAGYPSLGLRIYRGRRRRGDSPANSRLYAAFTVLAKFPMALGQARYYIGRLTSRPQRLIEYKRGE